MPWTEPMTNDLRRLHSVGLPFSAIAAELGVTRGSCIGRAYRIGLLRGRPVAKPRPPRRAPIFDPNTKPVRLLDLEEHHCRFPIGEPEQPGFGFCGAEKARGAYCEPHAAIAYQPPKVRR